jgi:pyridine nucleotide-disulfide oxidoreductase family protein
LRRLLLAGGGHAHVHVLHSLAQRPLTGVRVTLVTPFERQMYSGMVPGLVAGHYRTDDCVIPLPGLARAAGAEFVRGQIVALDAAARRVTLDDGRAIEYELLSLDTGPVMDRDALPGARAHGLFVRPIEHFVTSFETLLATARTGPLQLAVVGAGAAGVELALALSWRLGPAHTVLLVSGDVEPLDGFAAGVRRRAVAALRRRDITVLASACTAVAADHVQLANGARVPCSAALISIGASAPAWLADSGLGLDARGFVATGPTLQSRSHPEVFAAGDVATRTDAPHPKSGVYAVRAGPPLAGNLRAWLTGSALARYMPQRRTLYLLSLGEQRAIASWGGWAAEGRWVWRWKDRIDRRFIARYTAGDTVAGGATVAGS